MGEKKELPPVFVSQLLLCGWDWRLNRYRSIAGENAPVQEVFRVTLNRELEIAILKSVSDSLLKPGHQVIDCPNFHQALDLLSRREAQLHRCDDPKEAVSAVNQPK